MTTQFTDVLCVWQSPDVWVTNHHSKSQKINVMASEITGPLTVKQFVQPADNNKTSVKITQYWPFVMGIYRWKWIPLKKRL